MVFINESFIYKHIFIMKHRNLPLLLIAIGFSWLIVSSFSLKPENDPWVVPAKFQKMKNPTTADKESLSIGKSLYTKHCKSCHGTKGKGDGTKAAQLETPCGDFTTKEFSTQSDGGLFYKTSEGRDDMPSFKKKIPVQEDIWHIINYMRTLKN